MEVLLAESNLGAIVGGILVAAAIIYFISLGMGPTKRPCPECAEPIRQEARKCPHCGAEVPEGKKLTPAG